ncbi:MAG: dehydratase [Deltaproteobacteria bacterium]|nr:dehydratase [Deltaproteobacteria bacterium]
MKERYKTLPIRYAGASEDSNLIHIDDEFAKKSGMKSVILQGFCTLAFISQMMTDWLLDPSCLKELKGRFTGVVYPGDTITSKGKVVDKRIEEGRKKIICEVWAENQKGEIVIGKGLVVAEVPSEK